MNTACFSSKLKTMHVFFSSPY